MMLLVKEKLSCDIKQQKAKRIGIRVNNIYKLEVDGYAATMGKADQVVSRDEGESWHRRLGHIHHGELKVMQHISTSIL